MQHIKSDKGFKGRLMNNLKGYLVGLLKKVRLTVTYLTLLGWPMANPKSRTDLLFRHSYLQSLLEDTNLFLGDSKLTLIHTDDSFSLFDPRIPNPWLLDVAQAEWLLANQNQIANHGKRFLRRIFELPQPRDQQLGIKERSLFRATVKAVVHMQLYESVRVGIWLLPSKRSRRLSFTFVRSGRHRITWPAWKYYDGVQHPEARRGDSIDLNEVERRLEDATPEVLWLAPYREEHFERGVRVSLPTSWRTFLMILHARRCDSCNCLVRNTGELDHMRPLKPEESQFHNHTPGNSVLFNLTLLCRKCNRKKYTGFLSAPEEYIPQLIWDRRLALYFRVSLGRPPSKVEHVLPEYPSLPSEELAIK